MKNFAFAALVAVVAAQIKEPGTPMHFPTATDGDISQDAFLNEIKQTSNLGTSAVWWAQFTTTCNDCNFQDDGLIQSWMQVEGSEPGKFDGFTCTAQYN